MTNKELIEEAFRHVKVSRTRDLLSYLQGSFGLQEDINQIYSVATQLKNIEILETYILKVGT